MSTHSRIGILNDDGSVTSVYVHFDGYPSGVGLTLERHWTGEDEIRAMIDRVTHAFVAELPAPAPAPARP